MTTPASVLGCVGLCRVGFVNPTQVKARFCAALRAVCRVCWVLPRACACVMFYRGCSGSEKNPYARAEKPNKPNTPHTDALKALIYIGFKCVGFVLGIAVLCWVGVQGQENGHD